MSKIALIGDKIIRGIVFLVEFIQALWVSFVVGRKLIKIAKSDKINSVKIELAREVMNEYMPKLTKEWREAKDAYGDIF